MSKCFPELKRRESERYHTGDCMFLAVALCTYSTAGLLLLSLFLFLSLFLPLEFQLEFLFTLVCLTSSRVLRFCTIILLCRAVFSHAALSPNREIITPYFLFDKLQY